MIEKVLHLFEQYPHLAILISLSVSVLVAVAGLIPSVFVTAANILFFGFWQGTFISFLGEALGAIIAFWLYRKGFKKITSGQMHKYPKIQRLVQSEGKQAFLLILSLRLLPFMPSGLITFAAAIGTVHALVFLVASSLGKIPALLIEAYSVNEVTKFEWQGKLILAIVALTILYFVIRHMRSK